MIEFLEYEDVDFVTPYDHLDYYEHPLHQHRKEKGHTKVEYGGLLHPHA